MSGSDDHFHDECGIFGAFNCLPHASDSVRKGLHALQHRGQEGTGIISFDSHRGTFSGHHGVGLVREVFSGNAMLGLPGDSAIGHVRYSTHGSKEGVRNLQPLSARTAAGEIALAHNGNLLNGESLRGRLVSQGHIFRTSLDSEILLHLLTSGRGDHGPDLAEALRQVEGAYSLVVLTGGVLMGARDPLGIRPLVLGTAGNGKSWYLASESCALDAVGAHHVRDVGAGEIVVISGDDPEPRSLFISGPPQRRAFCIFEYIYFARPDSLLEGRNVYAVRKEIGRQLAAEAGVEADMVVPVPDSGTPAALGFAIRSGIPLEFGIVRSPYVGRTFIAPDEKSRNDGLSLKHNINRSLVAGKSVVMIDDSIVRGNTSQRTVAMLRAAGAREIHMRIASPPTLHPCFYGVDTPSRRELVAAGRPVEVLRTLLDVDSLAFISIEGLFRAVEAHRDQSPRRYCDACFSGDYPLPVMDAQEPREK